MNTQTEEEIRASVFVRLQILSEKLKISVEEAAEKILNFEVISPEKLSSLRSCDLI